VLEIKQGRIEDFPGDHGECGERANNGDLGERPRGAQGPGLENGFEKNLGFLGFLKKT